jgi:non-heme chloroperoxidase
VCRSDDNPQGLDPAYFEAFRSEQLMRNLPKWLDENMGPFLTPDTAASFGPWMRAICLSASAQALLECNRALCAADFRSELRALRVPTLIVHGDADVSAPLELTARRTVELIPDAELIVYPGAPHGLFLTHADRLNRDLARFAGGGI